MSKGSSGYFSGTCGAGQALIDEVQELGFKINSSDVIGITKDSTGKILWLENGHLDGKASGLAHILDSHGNHFNNKGIPTSKIPDFILSTVAKGKIVGYQGKGKGRPIYEITYHGVKYKVAVTIGSNGYIVGANPR